MISLFCSMVVVACVNNSEPSKYFNNEIQVENVYDGDTIKIIYPGLPPELGKLSVRFRGVDTPEIKGKCDSEKKKAISAKNFTKKTIEKHGNNVLLENMSWDKYGGRLLADVYVIEKTTVGYKKVNLSDLLIKNGHGRKYDGKQRYGWCK